MQTKTRHKKTARRSGRDTNPGQRSQSLRRRSKKKKATIARSGFGFPLLVPTGFFATESDFVTSHDFTAMRSDLSICYKNYCKISEVEPLELTGNVTHDLRTIIGHMEKIVKESSVSINLLNTKSLNGKEKLILPFLFVLLFVFFKSFQAFYNRQLEKYKNQ